MPRSLLPASRLAGLVLLVVVLALAVGCGKSDNLLPVEGAVSVDGAPLKVGGVTFMPDGSKGNKSQEMPAGDIKDGKYELRTGKKRGAPPGAYVVTVVSDNYSGDTPAEKGPTVEAPKSYIAKKYNTALTSPLRIEVTAGAAAGHYDLKLTKK